MMSSYMTAMSSGVGLTCDLGKDGRSELMIGNGWVEHQRPDGKRFFVNTETGRRTWSRPDDALPEQYFERCSPFVQKMQYEGLYPKGLQTIASDGYDCQSFLERLYTINEDKWTSSVMTVKALEQSQPIASVQTS